jgi:hypothetical protein
LAGDWLDVCSTTGWLGVCSAAGLLGRRLARRLFGGWLLGHRLARRLLGHWVRSAGGSLGVCSAAACLAAIWLGHRLAAGALGSRSFGVCSAAGSAGICSDRGRLVLGWRGRLLGRWSWLPVRTAETGSAAVSLAAGRSVSVLPPVRLGAGSLGWRLARRPFGRWFVPRLLGRWLPGCRLARPPAQPPFRLAASRAASVPSPVRLGAGSPGSARPQAVRSRFRA